MGYFNFRCFDPAKGKYVIIGLNVLIAILGVIHWAYAGVFGQFKSSMATSASTDSSLSVLSNSHIAFYAIAGIVLVGVSVVMLLLIFEILGKDNHLLWVRLILGLLILELAFSFFIAVQMSMMTNYWNVAYKDSIDAASRNTYSGSNNTIAVALLNWIRFSTAEAVITWIITLPCISAIIISFVDQLMTEENANKMHQSNPQTKAKTTAQVSPLPQNSMIGLQ